jgi:hypothetical protein
LRLPPAFSTAVHGGLADAPVTLPASPPLVISPFARTRTPSTLAPDKSRRHKHIFGHGLDGGIHLAGIDEFLDQAKVDNRESSCDSVW